jgi:hypothetical protein
MPLVAADTIYGNSMVRYMFHSFKAGSDSTKCTISYNSFRQTIVRLLHTYHGSGRNPRQHFWLEFCPFCLQSWRYADADLEPELSVLTDRSGKHALTAKDEFILRKQIRAWRKAGI